jgi:hypothetical protein
MVFEARRISDRRRLSALLSYMNTQKCRVQMLRAYFGEPEGAQCGLCDSDAGLDSEVFDPGSADERHGLHAATDFHARPRRRRRGRGAGQEAPMHAAAAAPPPPPRFETEIPSDILPPLAAFEVPPPPDSEQTFDEGLWAATDAGVGDAMPGDAVVDLSEDEHDTGAAPAQVAQVMAARKTRAPRRPRPSRTSTPAGRRSATPTFDRTPSGARARRSRSLCWWRARFRAAATRATTPATTATAAGAAAAIATITGAAAGPAADSTAAGAAAVVASGSGGAGATATAATVTTTGAIITGTAIASAVPGCRASIIQAATSVAAVARRRLVSPPLPGGD